VSVCLSVCLSLRSLISKTTSPNFTKFSVHVTFVAVALSFSDDYAVITYLGFVDDIMFSQWSTIKHDVKFRPVRQGRSLMSKVSMFCLFAE